ncbi:alcohol oxidase [Meredithblackwellia eburnea MCA 4105]
MRHHFRVELLLLLSSAFLSRALPSYTNADDPPLRATPFPNSKLSFDYIIVGGGTAGLAVASRLSETKGVKVIVVEAGIDYEQDPFANTVVSVPGLDTQGAGSDPNNPSNIIEIDWGFNTVPQKGAANRTVHYERGKTLGGSSTRHFMIYQRGTKSSYDAWEALGNKGWGWEDLQPYFEKSVNYLPPDNSLRRLQHPTPIDPALAVCKHDQHKRQDPLSNSSSTFISVPNTSSPTSSVSPSSSSSSTATSASSTPTFKTFGKGPISLSLPPFAQEFGPFMIGALKELGVPETNSFNGGVLKGVQFCTSTIGQAFKQVIRSTSRSGYLGEVEKEGREQGADKEKGQLVVLTKALVKRIIFEEGTTKAIGVVFVESSGSTSSSASLGSTTPGLETSLYATREVILSAGAFQSPQLLMVSGIGPKCELEKHGIEVKVDLPGVGQGMEDHVFFGQTFPVNVTTFSVLANNPTLQAQELKNFSVNGLGPFTNPIADVIAFERFSNETLELIGAGELLKKLPADWPILEHIISPGFPGNFSVLGFNPSTPAFPVGQQYATILAALVATQSLGTVTLQSANMEDPPLIGESLLSPVTAKLVAIAAFRRLRQFWSTSFMGQILDNEEIFPGPNVTTDAQILQFVRENLMTVWHASCTCAMKPREINGVLDDRLRVYGTEGLRVIDVSSLPLLPPGHPQSSVYALAEKGSDLIKQDNHHHDCD